MLSLRKLRVSVRLVSICLSVALLSIILAPLSALGQGPVNLLQNPGFEQPYYTLAGQGKENCFIAGGWEAYWYDGSKEEVAQGFLLAPEYKMATRQDQPGNRVHGGELSQQWFHTYGNYRAGIRQQVANIAPGSRVRFELWGFAWSCDNEKKGNCGGYTSGDPSPMHFRVGIDPTGGSDPLSPAIVWSPEQDTYDKWSLFSVEAVAKSSQVTAFVYTYPDFRSQNNDIYVDDASLIVVAPPPTATPRPTNTLAPTNTTAPTATPKPTDAPAATATPKPSDTPAATATPKPSNTPLPTNTPPPTATPLPTSTPVPTPTPVPPSLLGRLTSSPGLLIPVVGLIVIVGAGVGIVLSRRSRL